MRRCGCEYGKDCTKTTVCAVDSAVEDAQREIIGSVEYGFMQDIVEAAKDWHFQKLAAAAPAPFRNDKALKKAEKWLSDLVEDYESLRQ